MNNIEAALRRLENDAGVCAENRKLAADFAQSQLAKGLSRVRIVKCVYCMRYLAKWLGKPFSEASKQDLVVLVSGLEGMEYSENSKYDFKIVLKMFFRWLKGDGDTYPPEVAWLKPRLKNKAHKLPEELLSEEDVLNLARAATNPRDRAFVLILYESGCRIGELISLKVKNVQFDQYGAVLRVTGKTGDRRVRIISSAPALTAWLDAYPRAIEPNAPLWPPRMAYHAQRGVAAEYRSIYVMLRTLAKRAGIRKNVFPHLFRHSRATFLASKMTEAQMKEYFGWTQSSNMAATYVHLSGRDVDSTLLQMHAMADAPKTQETILTVHICSRCHEKNSPSQAYCGRCGNPFDASKLIVEQNRPSNDVMDELYKDPEVKEFLDRKSKALKFAAQLV
ncbi:MAG: site-specific integrase [Candidatus Micrarchaeota archaeon]